jgi:hypothetical protein
MNESVLSGIIFAAQFSVGAVISSVGILALAGTFIAVNRLFHMFWIPTNLVQKMYNFLGDNKKVGPIGVPVKTPDGKIVVNVGEGGGGGIIRKTRRDKIDEKMEAAFKDGIDLSGKNTP